MHNVIATTPTLYAFAVCLLVVAPVLAVFAASVQRERAENPWGGALLVGGSGWAGWIVSGVVAAMLFPRYPASSSPPEAIAMLFVLPGLLSSGAALRWLVTRKAIERRGSRRYLLGVVVVGTLLSLVLVFGHVEMTTWPARRELPDDAQVIDERITIDDFLGDFEYELRARMSASSFRLWMRQLGVEASNEPTRYGVPHDYIDHPCGSQGNYADGIGVFNAWCS